MFSFNLVQWGALGAGLAGGTWKIGKRRSPTTWHPGVRVGASGCQTAYTHLAFPGVA